MAGIQIPIGGDMGPFAAVLSQLRREMKSLTGNVRSAMAPAKSEGTSAAAAIKKIWQSTAGASTRMRVFKTAVGAIGPVMASAKRAAATTFAAILSGVRAATSAMSRMGSAMRSALPGGGGGMLGPIVGIAGLAAGIGLVTSQLKGAFQAAAAFEDLEVRVSSFLNSTTAAKDLLKELSDFADKTPFATTDIQEAAGALLGSGIRGDIAGLTKDLAAVSRNGQQLRELADALGKGFAKGKFQTEELNKFLERGINLMPALRKETGLTGNALTKAIENGLAFDTVSNALASLSREGGAFFGLLERRSKTATGLVSTLASVWDTVRRTFAQPIVDAIKPILTDAIAMVESFKARAATIGKTIGDALLAAFALVKSGKTFELLRAGFAFAITGAIDLLTRGLRSAVAFLATALPPIFEAATAKLRDGTFWQGIGVFLQGAAAGFAAEIRSALGQTDLANSMRRQSEMQQRFGGELISRAGGVDASAVASQALMDGMRAAGEAMRGPSSQGFQDARQTLGDLLRSVSAEAAAMRAQTAVPAPAEGATGETNSGPVTSTLGTATRQLMTLTTSLARVGGGGFGMTFNPVVTEQKKGNNLLRRIEENTRRAFAPVPVIA